ncbi:MAG: hypothetical protein AAGH15_18370 [Myxococcota bacterium]
MNVQEALSRVEPGLARYQWIQANFARTDARIDRDFRRRFNGFYRVRRNKAWQAVFYAELEREKRERRGFEAVLRSLNAELGRVEASFASKLVATVDPREPVIDSLVLRNVGMRLPAPGSARRLDGVVAVHRALADWYAAALVRPVGVAALRAFDATYPDADLTPLKKLDLILWQLR